jgi:BON domain-containing protein
MTPILCSDVAALAKAALSQSRIFDLRRLAVEHDGESIVLRGRVDSFYHKQLAQELVRVAVDGTEVINAIHVVYRPDDSRW